MAHRFDHLCIPCGQATVFFAHFAGCCGILSIALVDTSVSKQLASDTLNDVSCMQRQRRMPKVRRKIKPKNQKSRVKLIVFELVNW